MKKFWIIPMIFMVALIGHAQYTPYLVYTLVNGVPTPAPTGSGSVLAGGNPPSILCYALDGSNQPVPCSFTGAGGPPSGPAGGDLSGSYPNPFVMSAAHVSVGSLVNVLSAGATGNGSSNDTAAFQSLLNSGKGIYVPPGTYMVSGLTVHGSYYNGALLGIVGSTIICDSPSTTTIKLISNSNANLVTGDIQGYPTYSLVTTLNPAVTANSGNGDGTNDVTIRNCNLDVNGSNQNGSGPYHAIEIYGPGTDIESNVIQNAKGDGVRLESNFSYKFYAWPFKEHGFTVKDNFIKNNGLFYSNLVQHATATAVGVSGQNTVTVSGLSGSPVAGDVVTLSGLPPNTLFVSAAGSVWTLSDYARTSLSGTITTFGHTTTYAYPGIGINILAGSDSVVSNNDVYQNGGYSFYVGPNAGGVHFDSKNHGWGNFNGDASNHGPHPCALIENLVEGVPECEGAFADVTDNNIVTTANTTSGSNVIIIASPDANIVPGMMAISSEVTTGSTTNGSNQLTVGSATGIVAGQAITCLAGVATINTVTVSSIVSTTVTMSGNATATGNTTCMFSSWRNGVTVTSVSGTSVTLGAGGNSGNAFSTITGVGVTFTWPSPQLAIIGVSETFNAEKVFVFSSQTTNLAGSVGIQLGQLGGTWPYPQSAHQGTASVLPTCVNPCPGNLNPGNSDSVASAGSRGFITGIGESLLGGFVNYVNESGNTLRYTMDNHILSNALQTSLALGTPATSSPATVAYQNGTGPTCDLTWATCTGGTKLDFPAGGSVNVPTQGVVLLANAVALTGGTVTLGASGSTISVSVTGSGAQGYVDAIPAGGGSTGVILSSGTTSGTNKGRMLFLHNNSTTDAISFAAPATSHIWCGNATCQYSLAPGAGGWLWWDNVTYWHPVEPNSNPITVTWANRPTQCAGATGAGWKNVSIRATDVGDEGSTYICMFNTHDNAYGWYIEGNNTRLIVNRMPFIYPSSGSVSVSGVLTMTTALSHTPSGAYYYLPAAAINTGQTAGWFYGVASNSTTAQLFQNRAAYTVATLPAAASANCQPPYGCIVTDGATATDCVTGSGSIWVQCQSNASSYSALVSWAPPAIPSSTTSWGAVTGGSYTQTTATTIPVPGCAMNVQASLVGKRDELDFIADFTKSANGITTVGLQVGSSGTNAVGGTTPITTMAPGATNISLADLWRINAQDSTSVQYITTTNGYGNSTSLTKYSLLDMTLSQNFGCSVNEAAATDYMLMEGFSLDLIRP